MPIKFRCDHCRQLLGISQNKAGEMVDCPTCGRGVRVPSLDGKSDPVSRPKWDPQDHSLMSALDSLASLTRGSAPAAVPEAIQESGAEQHFEEKQESAVEPGVAAVPEPIAMPPLETPVILPEPGRSTDSTDPPSSADPDTEQEPWTSLAGLSTTAPTDSPQPLAGPAGAPSTGNPSRNVTLPVALLLVVMAFALGFFVGQVRNASTPVTNTGSVEPALEPAESKPSHAITRESNEPPRRAVEGRVTFLSDSGSSRPDTGAVVILLPAYRNSSTRLPIVGFRPADSQEDREIARAAIEALGGDLAIVDEQGTYACDLPQAGEYHLVILSRHLEREGAGTLKEAPRTMLGKYFDRPAQLVGQRQFHVAEVSYRGEIKQIRDHTFESES